MASSPKKEVIPDELWHVHLEFCHYAATSWHLLTVLTKHFTSGTADLQDSHTPTHRRVVLEPNLFMEFIKYIHRMSTITIALVPSM